jgi:sigma-B regulation protein RsbU (phosphoserine phosphatase)
MAATGPLGTVRRPAQVAVELNRRFKAGESDGRYFTMVLCVLDTRLGILHFTAAGHPLPVVLRAGAVVPMRDIGGLPIAIMDDSEYEDAAFQLEPGDRVCLVSDGLIEQYDAAQKEQLGMQRLVALLERLHATPADEAVKVAIAALADWAGGPTFADDVSLVLIDWLGN